MTFWDHEGLTDNSFEHAPDNTAFPAQSSRTAPQGKEIPSSKSHKKPWFTRSIGFTFTSAPATVIYEGYKFFKADPIPGQEPSWTKVERTKMHMTQRDFCRKVQKRANKISAAQQYQFLSGIRQAHVNQLIAELRPLDPSVEWSCVYAKEREKPSKARNNHRDDYEIVSMQIILMKRPVETKTHFRTPMGDLVDLGVHFGSHPNRAKIIREEEDHEVDQSLLTAFRDRSVPAFPTTQRSQRSLSNEGAGHLRGAQEPLARPATATAIRRRPDIDHDQTWRGFENQEARSPESQMTSAAQEDGEEEEEGYVSENIQEEDTAPPHQTPTSETSTVGSPGNVSCSCQESAVPQNSTFDARQHSPSQYDFGFRSHFERRPLVPNGNDDIRRNLRNEPWYNSCAIPAKRHRSSVSDARMWEKKIRIQQMNEEEMRDRLLDCEARIEQWEKILQNQTRILGLQMRIEAPPGQRFQL
ncbi:uncharacterized protein N7484_004859 [Penicillium longicatenatum]|uniref:uncharacterized protein n=1 Tax=Penicillium longicatenatum TaxID=1561947 RepID=UPI00254714C9|nr:uncharacterized protein N7484_004859 [Penicillium longicatenatum]KAJ5651136.1 hypothetical protein N7484_004859 [Penicillium longicatenatum]